MRWALTQTQFADVWLRDAPPVPPSRAEVSDGEHHRRQVLLQKIRRGGCTRPGNTLKESALWGSTVERGNRDRVGSVHTVCSRRNDNRRLRTRKDNHRGSARKWEGVRVAQHQSNHGTRAPREAALTACNVHKCRHNKPERTQTNTPENHGGPISWRRTARGSGFRTTGSCSTPASRWWTSLRSRTQ